MKKPSARETRGAILLAALTAALLALTLWLTPPSGDTLPPTTEAPDSPISAGASSPISAGASAPASSVTPADSISPISPKSPIPPKSPKKSKKSRRRGAAPAPRHRSPLDESAH